MLKYDYSQFLLLVVYLFVFFVVVLRYETNDVFYLLSCLSLFVFIESIYKYLFQFKKSIFCELEKTSLNKNIFYTGEEINLLFKADKKIFGHRHAFIENILAIDNWIENDLLNLTFTVNKRSVLSVSDLHFIEKDFVNLSRLNFIKLNDESKIIVLPTPCKNNKLEYVIDKKTESEKEIFSTLEYRPGDSYKNMNWKKTGKHNKLMTNNFYTPKNKSRLDIDLFIDTYSQKKDFEILLQNLVYLLTVSPQKNNVNKIIIDEKEYDFSENNDELLAEIATLSPKKISKKIKDIFPKNCLVLTTRNLTIKNKVVVKNEK